LNRTPNIWRKPLANTSNFKNGMVLNMKNGLWSIVDFQHVKPGKGPAFVRTKLKNVQTGKVIEETFRAGEKVEDIRLERRDYQFLYVDADFLTFMSLETYEQVSLPKETLGDLPLFVKESETVSMLLRDDVPLTVEPPQTVDLKVADTDPGLKGDTAQGGTKPATMETGLVVLVPLFIEIGEVLKIDTKTKKYLGRVN
jgi:elongation factor P